MPSSNTLSASLTASLAPRPAYEMTICRMAAGIMLLAQALLFFIQEHIWESVWQWPAWLGYIWAAFWALTGLIILWKPYLLSRNPLGIGIVTGALLLVVLASWQAHHWAIPQLIEMTIRWSSPLIWLGLAIWPFSRWEKITRLAIALTFTGHGLFALGFPSPTPSGFFVMTQEILGLNALQAQYFLRVVGTLDLVVLVALFIPPLTRPVLLYATFWGLVTAIARSWAYLEWGGAWDMNVRWLAETLVRLPHGLLPLALWFALRPESLSRPAPLESELEGQEN